MIQPVTIALADTGAATSTAHNFLVAWPYVLVSVLVVLSLIGTAVKLLRNQNDQPQV